MIKSFTGLKIFSVSLLLVGIVFLVITGRLGIMLAGLAAVAISFMGSSDFKKRKRWKKPNNAGHDCSVLIKTQVPMLIMTKRME